MAEAGGIVYPDAVEGNPRPRIRRWADSIYERIPCFVFARVYPTGQMRTR